MGVQFNHVMRSSTISCYSVFPLPDIYLIILVTSYFADSDEPLLVKCNQSDRVLGGAVWRLQTGRRMLHESRSIGFLNYLILSAIGHKQHSHLISTHARYRWVSNENKSHMKCLPRLPEQLQTCSSARGINTIPPEDFRVVMVAITLYPMGPKSPCVHLRFDPLPAKDIAQDSNPFSSLSDPSFPVWKHLQLLCFSIYLFWGLPRICRPSSVFKGKATVSPSPLLFSFLQRLPNSSVHFVDHHKSSKCESADIYWPWRGWLAVLWHMLAGILARVWCVGLSK